MRTVHNQTEGSVRPRFRYEPDRHYVRAQIPDSHWDGGSSLVPTTPEQFLDIWDEEKGEFAYRMEANGAERDGQKITSSPRLALISCSKEYAARSARRNEAVSRTNMAQKPHPLRLPVGQEMPESFEQGAGINLKTAFQQSEAAQAQKEALLNSSEATV
jgi:hypothetical protein